MDTQLSGKDLWLDRKVIPQHTTKSGESMSPKDDTVDGSEIRLTRRKWWHQKIGWWPKIFVDTCRRSLDWLLFLNGSKVPSWKHSTLQVIATDTYNMCIDTEVSIRLWLNQANYPRAFGQRARDGKNQRYTWYFDLLQDKDQTITGQRGRKRWHPKISVNIMGNRWLSDHDIISMMSFCAQRLRASEILRPDRISLPRNCMCS